ncbi:MAG: ABC transporter permease subunit [Pseudomonadota bacterium]
MIQRLIAIFRKELRESLRDKRSLTAAATFAIAGPVLVAGMLSIVADKQTRTEPIEVAVTGATHAPDLIAFLTGQDVIVEAPDAATDVRMVIPVDYGTRFAEGRLIRIEVIADRSRTGARRDASRVERLITTYSAELGQLRLLMRGVAPSVVRPVVVDGKDTASAEARSTTVLGLLGIYFLLAAFVGSMAVAIDSSAGERERNSLEVLMAQPVSPLAVFSGKWVNALLFGTLGIAMALLASRLAFSQVPLTQIGITWSLDATAMGLMLLGLLPLAGFAAALQLSLAMWAKTFKEASAYLNMLSFIPAIVAFVVVFQEIEPETWMYAVPVLGHQQMLTTMMRAEPLSLADIVLLTSGTGAITAAIIFAGARMLTRERIVFGQLD